MNTKIVSYILAVCILMLTGCATVRKIMPGKAAQNPPTSPPVIVQIPSVPAPPVTSAQVAMATQVRTHPRRVTVSVFDDVISARPGVYASSASVVINNRRTEKIAIQIGDRLLGVPDENGLLGVVILPPGESFTLHDLGLGQKTVVKAIVMNDQDERIGYVGAMVNWPRGWQEGGETQWDVKGGTAAGVQPAGVDPMITLPRSSSTNGPSVTSLTAATP